MSNQDLQNIISYFNGNKILPEIIVFQKPISENVIYATIWDKKPVEDDEISNSKYYKYFLIKDSRNKYIAIVHDMGNDLHWYVEKEYRKKGYLTKNLSETIIPFLSRTRQSQRVTIDIDQIGEKEYLNSKRVAVNIGFKAENSKEFHLDLAIHNQTLPSLSETSITEDKMFDLRRKFNYLHKYSLLLLNEVEMGNISPDYVENLNMLTDKIYSNIWKFEDAWHKTVKK